MKTIENRTKIARKLDYVRFGQASEAKAVSVVIPAYNEQHRIGSTLRDLVGALPEADIIVVLNGCTDGTREVVESVKTSCPNVRMIEIDAPIGKGGAIRTGILASNADVIAYVDADGATTGAELARLVSMLNGCDAVIGSRWLKDANITQHQPLLRRILSRGFNFLTRVLFGLPYSDTQCGAKVFSGEALRQVMKDVETSSLAIDVDILYNLWRCGRNIHEVPTSWTDVAGSKVDPVRTSLRMLASVLRLRLKYSLLKYAVPWFDRILPTNPMSTHSTLQILICNWRDVHNPQAGGAETYLHEQAKRWVADGHGVTWLTAGFHGGGHKETIDGVDVVRVGSRATVYLAVPLYYIAKLRNRFDIIVDAENGIPFFTPLFSMKPKKLLIFHVHRDVFLKYLPPPISWFFVWIESKLMPLVYKNVDFITISSDSKADIERYHLTSRPIEIIHSGVDSNLRPGTRSEEPLISYVGRLRAYKRVDWLITAFAEVLKAVPAARLAIAGAGDEDERLRELAADLGIAHACDFMGFITEQEKCSLLQRSWLFASASSMEGWGISVIEANACGTPAVVFNVPGLSEAVIDGVSGVVLHDRSELAPMLTLLLENDEKRMTFARGALTRAAEFSWDRTAANTLEVLLRDAAATTHRFVLHQGDWMLVSPADDAVH